MIVYEPKSVVIINGRTMVCVNPDPCEDHDHVHWYKHEDEAITYSHFEREVCE